MGRYLDALIASEGGGVSTQKNLNNPSGDSCLGFLGAAPPPVLKNNLDPVGQSAEAIPLTLPASPDERAAIIEYDGGLLRDEAERQAGQMTVNPATSPSCDVPDRHGHWSESETLLCIARTRQFVRRGVPEAIADDLACRLVQRDRDQDDRRSCAECRSLRNGACVQGRVPVCGGGVEVLHRCKTFIDPEVKND